MYGVSGIMPGIARIRPSLWALVLGFVLLQAQTVQARTIVDMRGRQVEVPETISSIYAASPPALYLLYAVEPKVIAGWNFSIREENKRYLTEGVLKLPVLGGWFGQGHSPNIESVMAEHPDIMLVSYWKDTAYDQLVEETAATMGLPVVYVCTQTLEEYAQAFRFLGDLLNIPKRTAALAEYTERALKTVNSTLATLPLKNRVRVYYAEGRDGLKTESTLSTHAQLIELAGGRNVQQGKPHNGYGMESVSIEEVMIKNPAVILAQDKNFTNSVYDQSQWQTIDAVQNKRIHLIPRVPFNWFDRPPSFMRILGIQWLTALFYPEYFQIDMTQVTRNFYSLFLNVDLRDEEIQDILHP